MSSQSSNTQEESEASVELPMPPIHTSLFDSISKNIPLPPPKIVVDIPTTLGSPLPVDEEALDVFWSWQDESVERFKALALSVKNLTDVTEEEGGDYNDKSGEQVRIKLSRLLKI